MNWPSWGLIGRTLGANLAKVIMGLFGWDAITTKAKKAGVTPKSPAAIGASFVGATIAGAIAQVNIDQNKVLGAAVEAITSDAASETTVRFIRDAMSPAAKEAIIDLVRHHEGWRPKQGERR